MILQEMRPVRKSPAHHSQELAELVCSNSFGAKSSDRAAGLLHEELRRLGSIVIETADQHSVPAGGALAVDRAVFSSQLTATLASHPLIELRREEITTIPSEGSGCPWLLVLLTSPKLTEDLQRFTGMEYLSFFRCCQSYCSGRNH